jgi:hypothetical protein
MNHDSHLIFEAYLSEMALRADYPKVREVIVNGLKGRAGNSYLFKTVADKTGKSTEEVVDMIVKPVIDVLFPGGKFSSTGERKEQINKLQNAIHQQLAREHGGAVSGYTARIIKNFIADVVEEVEEEVEQGETAAEAEGDVTAAIASVADKPEAEVEKDVEAEHGAELQAAPEDKATTGMNALMQHAVTEVGDGIKEDELVEILKQHIVQKDSDISTARAVGQAKGIINKLVGAKVLAKRGNILEPGDNADEFAEKGDLSLVSASPEEYAAREFGVGARPTSGRQVFGGEDRYSGMFG